jgi:Cytochrome P450
MILHVTEYWYRSAVAGWRASARVREPGWIGTSKAGGGCSGNNGVNVFRCGIIFVGWVPKTYKAFFQPVQTPCVFLDNHAGFLLTVTFETISSMYSLFLALVLFPQVQRRAQAELDVVIGRDRLPTFDDRPRLPYIEALCKELMRWQMVTPMGTIQRFS